MILNSLSQNLLNIFFKNYRNSWVLMDRDSQADDNAEHLYRFIRENYPNRNIYFLLRKKSHDWVRLKNDGFRLIPFSSLKHMILMFNACHLISSHADNYVFNFPPQKWFGGIKKYHYIFLQHGVIKDDLSNWLNKKPIDLFVTTTQQEYQSIVGENSNYKFTPKEVCLTGLARHDVLLKKQQECSKRNLKKILLIMPTWRQNLVGKTEFMSNNRSKNKAFYTSQYALFWKQFLHSYSLKKIVDKHNLDVVFFPHANIAPYLKWFDVPTYIKPFAHDANRSIQDLFIEASVLLTDYSSVAFDLAYLEKPVLYYQFDHEQVFGGEHLTAKGYYDYNDDGFGPVSETGDAVLQNLEQILKNGCVIEDRYKDRISKTFMFRDGKCCKRIYEAIIDLEEVRK